MCPNIGPKEGSDFGNFHSPTSEIFTMAHCSQLLGYFILNMNETEGHSPSLSKFLKQLFLVFNRVANKKENNTFLKHYKRPTERGKCSILERILEKGFSNFYAKIPYQKRRTKKNLPLGHQEV